ncbi:hypothetical protein GCM10023196_016760 [Actinoallomurus vinaceus]|uniref:Uncharacterized protein n=1 Tax=Actinoallomurus vinaceus TaxID=1080074 RepID=A0ABP8U770_9ACTN
MTDADAGVNAKLLIDTVFAATGAPRGAVPEPPAILIPGIESAGAFARGAGRAPVEVLGPQPQAACTASPPMATSAAGRRRPRAKYVERFICRPIRSAWADVVAYPLFADLRPQIGPGVTP